MAAHTTGGDPNRLGAKLEQVHALARTKPRGTGLGLGRPSDLLTDDELADVQAEVGRARDADWSGAIPSRFRWAQLGDFDPTSNVTQALVDWAALPAGRNLVLGGPVGVGKTHAAVAACRADAFERGLDVLFKPAVELLDELRPGGPPDALAELCAVDRLIIDDLGAERPTDWTAERLYAVINRRWLEERPTICTTNIDLPAGLEATVGPRLFSRLIGSGAVVLVLRGPDRRRANP